MSVLSSKKGNDDPTGNFFDKYCLPSVEIKDFDAVVDNKPFFWSVSKKQTKSV